MTAHSDGIALVSQALAGRPLYWFGIRGEDAQPLLAFEEFAGSFAITARLSAGSVAAGLDITLETQSGVRVDLDRYDLDDDQSAAAARFRGQLLEGLSRKCVVLAYRPAGFLSSLSFAMRRTLTVAAMLKDRQRGFEFKPWVETELRERGVPVVGWDYVPDGHRSRAKRFLSDGPIVLRASRASGGVGMVRVDTPEGIDQYWPNQSDSFVAVAPYLDNAVPVNFAGCVFEDGRLTLHSPSIQLIGLEQCTRLPFGYCGNDFGAVAALGEELLRELDDMGREVGRWLHDHDYLGAFGVDAMIHQGRALFTEVNARFQGSSSLSAVLAEELGESSLYLDHLAAHLRVSNPSPGLSLRDWALKQRAVSHVVVHNTTDANLNWVGGGMKPETDLHLRVVQLPVGTVVAPGGVLGRLVVDRSVTSSGFALDVRTMEGIGRLQERFSAHSTGVLSAS